MKFKQKKLVQKIVGEYYPIAEEGASPTYRLKAYIITIKGNKLSEDSAQRTLEGALKQGLDAEIYYGIDKYNSMDELEANDLVVDNTDGVFTNYSYLDSAVGCFMSHYKLWEKSVSTQERFLILEHDVKFTDKVTDYENYAGVLNIGKPLWGKAYKQWYSPDGCYQRDCRVRKHSFVDEYHDCNCEEYFLHGAHAYIVNPESAHKLINHARDNGILPADNFINRDVVSIADAIPFCCEQVTEFSTIQTAHPIHGYKPITGDSFVRELVPESAISGSQFPTGDAAWITIEKDKPKVDTKVMVFLADESHIDKVKPLITNAKIDGKWDGDFCVIVPHGTNTDSLDQHLIKVFEAPELVDTPTHFSKLFALNGYFLRWDWIFYCDMDIWFTNPIDLKLKHRDKNLLYVNTDRLPFIEHFYGQQGKNDKDKRVYELSHFQKESIRQIKNKAKVNNVDIGFQTCFMLWHTDMNQRYDSKMWNNYFKYYVYSQVCREKMWDQSLFNLTFMNLWDKKRWYPLNRDGCNFVQSTAVTEVDWDIDKLRNGYYDGTDTSDATAIHFTGYFPPWQKYNRRYYRKWEEYFNRTEYEI